MFTALVVVSSCSNGSATQQELSAPDEVIAELSATSPLPPTTTTTATGIVSTTIGLASAEAASVFDGGGCVYDGGVEFPLNTTVIFSFTNTSDDTPAGYSIWKVPDGRTTEDIREHGILGIGTHLLTDMKATSQPTPPGVEAQLEMAFEVPGSYAVNCFVPDGGTGIDYPATILEVLDR